MSDPQTTDTNNGFLVGVQPAQPRSADWQNVDTSAVGASQQPPVVVVTTPPAPATDARFTTEDIERVRKEEKDKLYGRISQMDEQLKALTAEREAREQAEAEALRIADEERQRREQEEMSANERIEALRKETEERLAEVTKTYERDRAIFEREQRLMQLETYKRDVMAQNEALILPELRDLVHGETEEMIDASVQEMIERSNQIMQNVAEAAGTQRQQMRGVASTAPPVGPMEQAPTYESLTPQDIAGMDMETYKRYRDGLLRSAGNSYRRG